jgi:hypothetical protein
MEFFHARRNNQLTQLGPFPSETSVTPEIVDSYFELIDTISPPVSLDEAKSLLTLFGTDPFFGVAWTLVHLIESCPEWSAEALANVDDHLWITLLRKRLQAR